MKKTIINMMMAVSAMMLMALCSCANSDISREGEMNCTYLVKDNRIVLSEWGDEVVWNYTIEGNEMVIEEQIYDDGVLFSQIFTRFQRK